MGNDQRTFKIDQVFLEQHQDDSTKDEIPVNRDQKISFRPFFLGFLVIILISAIAWPFIPRRYEATASIILRPLPAEGDAIRYTGYLKESLEENALQSEIGKLSSPALIKIVVDRHNLANDPEFTGSGFFSRFATKSVKDGIDDRSKAQKLRNKLLSHLSIWRKRRSYTVNFGFKANNPVKAAEMTETLLNAYVNDQISRKKQVFNAQSKILRERVDLMRTKATSSDHKVREFLLNTGLIDIGEQLSLEQQLKELSAAAAKLQIRVINAQARSSALARMKRTGMLDSAPEILSSSIIQHLKRSMANTVGRSNVLLTHTRAYSRRINQESDRIVRGEKLKATNLLKQKRMLAREIGLVRKTLTQRNRDKLELELLKREANTDKTVMDAALKRLRSQTGFAKSINADLEIVSRPEVPFRATFPNPRLTLLATLLFAFLAGVAAMWRSLPILARRFLLTS